MLRSFGELRRKVKTWLVSNNFTNVVMVDPLATFKASADIYAAIGMMADTVHLKDEGYRAFAQPCKQVITDCMALKQEKEGSGHGGGKGAKRPRLDSQGKANLMNEGGQASGSGQKVNHGKETSRS
jgi:hypothetical protein